jgi:ComF family protein
LHHADLPDTMLKKKFFAQIINLVKMKSLFKHVYKVFLDALFPSRCLICKEFFHHYNFSDPVRIDQTEMIKLSFNKVMGRFLCAHCVQDFSKVESPKCCICGFMFKSRDGEDHICGKCINNSLKYRKARAYGLYDRSLRKSIHLLKYYRKTYLAEPLGMLLFSTFIQNWDLEDIHVIIPTPLYAGRLKKRGFNQTFQLIRKWPEWLKKPGVDHHHIIINQDILFRKSKTRAQVGMSRKERIANIKDVFEVRDHSKIEDKNVLLIDDVLTTGATANECVKTLIKNGAKNVDVLTLAHTERHIR